MIKTVSLDLPIANDFFVTYNSLNMLYSCDFCHSNYQEEPSHHAKTKGHFCSRPCYWSSKLKRITKRCSQCGNVYTTTPRRDAKFCADPCRRVYQAAHKQDRQEILHRYNVSEKGRAAYRRWHQRKANGVDIVMPDSACLLCSSKSHLITHHRDGNNGRNGKPLNNAIENLVVLCRKCHPKVHSRWGIKEVVPYGV